MLTMKDFVALKALKVQLLKQYNTAKTLGCTLESSI